MPAAPPTIHFYDPTNAYNLADSATANPGDYFVLTGDNTNLAEYGLSSNISIMYGDNETLGLYNANGTSDAYAEGTNDVLTLANSNGVNVIDDSKGGMALDLTQEQGLVWLWNQQTNDPTAELGLPPGTNGQSFGGAVFIMGLTVTAADLTVPNAQGVSTLTMSNNSTVVDTLKIAGGATSLNLVQLNGAVLLTQNQGFGGLHDLA